MESMGGGTHGIDGFGDGGRTMGSGVGQAGDKHIPR